MSRLLIIALLVPLLAPQTVGAAAYARSDPAGTLTVDCQPLPPNELELVAYCRAYQR